MTASDLGGLGAQEGTPVSFNWRLPNLMPVFLPWVAILLLLLAKSNRCAQAWWIWAPLVCVATLERILVFPFLPSSLIETFVDVISALAFGIAAVWLLAPHLARRHRFVTFLCILPTLAGASALVCVIGQDWLGGEAATMVSVISLLGIVVFVVSVAMTFAGWACRGRYRPFRLSLWLIAALLVACLAATSPFFVFALIASGGRAPWLEFLGGMLAMAGVIFGTLLPFLALSFANSFFRERLKGLLHLKPMSPPPPFPAALASAA
ncbi:MAG: hypothetical protein HY360_02910 [Verrucomicrobia bacterium]|nr:hypothetical protein [Verrucomicrobiota bacterium]